MIRPKPPAGPTRSPAASGGGPLAAPGRRCVVTGGAGFIGSHLVECLLARGHDVHVVDDLSTGRLDNLAAVRGAARLSVRIAAVDEPAAAAAACVGADFVFHLAGVVGVRRLATEPLAVMQRNLRCTEEVLTAATRAGVPVLLASSSEVYGDGPVPFREQESLRPGSTEGLRGGYACAKAMGEWLALAHAQQSGLPVYVARLFNTVGPRQVGDHGMVLPRFVRQAVRGQPITVYGTGDQTRCFAHVAEVAKALVDLATLAPQSIVCNVGSAIETTVLGLAELVRERAASDSPIERVPFERVFPAGFVDPSRRVPALDRLQQAIGWVPSRPAVAIVDELLRLARQELDVVSARGVVAGSGD